MNQRKEKASFSTIKGSKWNIISDWGGSRIFSLLFFLLIKKIIKYILHIMHFSIDLIIRGFHGTLEPSQIEPWIPPTTHLPWYAPVPLHLPPSLEMKQLRGIMWGAFKKLSTKFRQTKVINLLILRYSKMQIIQKKVVSGRF